MTSNNEVTQEDSPFKDVWMQMGNNRQTRDAPLLLQNNFDNKLSLNIPTRWGSFRLGVAEGGADVEITPDPDTWVIPEAGKLEFTINPRDTGVPFTLVLYSRSVDEMLVFPCKTYKADHPWYPNSRVYLQASNTNGFFAHRGIVAVARDKTLGFHLFPVGKGLFGKKITLTVTGEQDVPAVFPVEPQVIENLDIWWRVTFDPADTAAPFTVWLEADGIAEKVGFEFLALQA
ncbi:hypothetical protein [Pseudomonas sp. MYb118]|uniref:hypothetical protein n=1 Tax=Pseudomonas sp. MYb118 TaxID=1848720 RepID=UPI0034CE3D21